MAAPQTAFALGNLLLPGKRLTFDLADLRNYELEEELYDLQRDPGERDNLLATASPEIASIASGLRVQLEAWAAKGWTAKQAAAAGEAVVLNGSGYNLTGAPLR